MPTVALRFVRAHLGKYAFAPLTGTDWRAWHAFVYLLELYGVSRDPRSVEAMKATLACAQTSVMALFIQTIPACLDWGDVRRLWPSVAPERADPDLCARDYSHDRKRCTVYWGFRPRCVQEMGCACALHARGGKPSEPCDATEAARG